MTGGELEAARAVLGLTAAQLGRQLELTGRDQGRSVRLWETGAKPVPGPVAVAVRLMIKAHLATPTQAPLAMAPAAPGPELDKAPEPAPKPLKIRRRGP